MKGLHWLRMLCWPAGVDTSMFLAMVISLLSVASAAQTSGTSVGDRLCPETRELVTTVWGGAFTLFALSFDSYGMTKDIQEDKGLIWFKILKRLIIFNNAILNPIFMVFCIIYDAVFCCHMSYRISGFTVWSFLVPWKKNSAKILSGCKVVINVPKMVSIPGMFVACGMPCLCEALVIGRFEEEKTNRKDIYLDYDGRGVLMEMDVLPPYDQLKILQGNSGLGKIISAVQSMGYIYGVVVRTIQGLPVSAIEVIALMLSIVILIKALLHNIASTCHRPLKVHLTHEEAALKFADMCKKYKLHAVPRSHELAPLVVMVMLLSSVLIYYIIHMWQTARVIVIVPMLLTLVGFYLPLIFCVVDNEFVKAFIFIISSMINATTYVFTSVGSYN